MRHRPARFAGDGAQLLAAGEIVELEHHAVDVETQPCAPHADLREVTETALDAFDPLDQRRHRKAPVVQLREGFGMPTRRSPAFVEADRIGSERQRPAGGDARIELPQTAGRGVAGIDRRLLAAGAGLLDHAPEALPGQVDLAAHLDPRRHLATQAQRDVADGLEVFGDVLAGLAVAAGRATHQQTLLVEQRYRQAIELGLAGVGGLFHQQGLADAAVEVAQLGLVVALAQRLHRQPVLTGANSFAGAPPTRWVGESGVSSSGCAVSSSCSSRNSASKAASEICGSSRT